MKKYVFNFYDPMSLKSYNLDDTMRYQLNMLDTLDVYTRKHSENVANITCRLCEYLKLDKGFTVYATVCAYLHDIGKLFIPSEILQKPSELTDEEYDVMKKHTTLGYEMCMKDLELRPFSAGALYHHEALNGTGYPQGLKGFQIPLVGQIIRVADEYDAIVNKRQYKSHVGISDTLRIIIENAFDVENLSHIVHNAKEGKNNKKVVRCLIKVVLDDTEYEISCVLEYLSYLKSEISRLKEADKLCKKLINAKKESKKLEFQEMLKYVFTSRENIDNYKQIIEEINESLISTQNRIDNLFQELKNIKSLRI